VFLASSKNASSSCAKIFGEGDIQKSHAKYDSEEIIGSVGGKEHLLYSDEIEVSFLF
jgi:hypothetical protein